MQQMPDSSVAIFRAAKEKTRSNDVTFEYRQDNNLYYLTGITDPNTTLVLVKNGLDLDHEATAEILFVPKSHPRMAAWLGATTSLEQAEHDFGLGDVRTSDVFGEVLGSLLDGKKVLYYRFEMDFLYEPLGDHRFFIGRRAKKSLREKYPQLKVKSPSKMLAQLRRIKSPAEVGLLRRAIDITCLAHIEAMRTARAGMFEYQLEAVIEYVFKHNGAEYPAFPSIVGSGPNSTILHHWRNRRKIEKGDLIVIDIGAEYHGYSADVTRTIPSSGKFSEQQREIYEIVLKAQKEAIAAVRPGVSFRDIHKVAKRVIEAAGYGKYFVHGTSHFLGLDTHDIGSRGLLEPGMVLTVEPGIYIRQGAEGDEAYWNIGVRIEDDILVTEDGYEILSKNAPREIDEIEKLMKQEGKVSSTFD